MKKILIASLVYTWLFTCLPAYNWAQPSPQEAPPAETKPLVENTKDDDIYSEVTSKFTTLVVDWGINSFQKAPSNMDLTFWRSRTLTGSIYYNIPIGKSHFMVSVGIGLGNEDYMFKLTNPEYTLDRNSQRKTSIVTAKKLIPASSEIQKSIFTVNYLDVIGEIKFNLDKEERQERFFLAVGGSLGIQHSPSTSIHYKEDSENKVRIIKESFNVKRLHYGVLARMGWGRFGIYYKQTLSGLFNDKGPQKDDILRWSAGISINLL